MSDFYQALAAVYEDVFPLSPVQRQFVLQHLPAAPAVVTDLGCATGALVRALAAAGYLVTGVDLDSQMIALAEQAAVHAELPGRASFVQADMLQYLTEQKPGDALLCLGNTLVHLSTPADVADLLRRCQAALRPGGQLLLQIVNYDRVLGQQLRELPPLLGKLGNQLSRHYRPRPDGRLDFLTTLNLASGDCIDSSVALLPLLRQQLQALLTAAGFGRVDFYGSYQGEPWTPATFHTIAVAARN